MIVKDDKTDYAFDTGIIEHIQYPRDLRFSRIVTFKAALSEKVLATHRAATANPEHSTFLKNFGKFQVASLTEAVVPADKIMFEMLQDIQMELVRMRRTSTREIIRGDKPEAVAFIAAAIQAYRAEMPKLNAKDLIGSSECYSYVMRRMVEAPSTYYYKNPSEFAEAVKQYLTEVARIEDQSEVL